MLESVESVKLPRRDTKMTAGFSANGHNDSMFRFLGLHSHLLSKGFFGNAGAGRTYADRNQALFSQ